MAKNSIPKKEQWKQLPSCLFYLVSNIGNVVSTYGGRHREMKQHCNHAGYKQVTLALHPKLRTHKVHRLVCEAFGIDCSQTIDHIDGNKANNFLSNLRPCSIVQNLFYAKGKDENLRGASYKAERGYWCAMTGRKYGQKYLGKFNTAQEAANAVRKYEAQHG